MRMEQSKYFRIFLNGLDIETLQKEKNHLRDLLDVVEHQIKAAQFEIQYYQKYLRAELSTIKEKHVNLPLDMEAFKELKLRYDKLEAIINERKSKLESQHKE